MCPRKNPDGTPDTRTTDERRGDAFAEWIEEGRDATPVEGGERAQVTVTIGPNLLPISVSEARRLACDCRVIPVILSAESMPLDIGRATRTIPAHIRRLVVERDQCCSFPDCVAPANQCQVHHILELQHGGEHKLPNLALLCKRHHRVIHHTEWEVRMAANGRPHSRNNCRYCGSRKRHYLPIMPHGSRPNLGMPVRRGRLPIPKASARQRR
jgi:hypothetical protein